MLENQKKLEEKQREKAEAERAAEEAKKKERLAAAAASRPITQDRGEKPAEFGNNVKFRKHLFAPLPAVTRGKPTLLGGSPAHLNKIVYCLSNDVIIRSLDDPAVAEIYTEHARPTTVARYSPDGKFVASADNTGTVRVWNTEIIQDTIFKLRLEKRALGGAILDMAWSPDSKQVVVVGNGKEKMADVFDAETGSGRGTIAGHSKTITTCDYRPTKPFRVVTGGEDFAVSWHEGPPFKWTATASDHGNFVNCVRYSPDGSLFVSVAQDKTGFFYDGETGAKRGAFDLNGGHKGGIYVASWSPDGTQVLTCSGDKTCKIWDVTTGKAVTTFEFGSAVEDMQVGCLWQGQHLVSLSLRGHLIYLDKSNPRSHIRVVKGHNKSIDSVAYHRPTNSLYTGSYDSVVTRWNADSGVNDQVGGDGHKNAVVRLKFQGDDMFTVSVDDTLRVTRAGSDFTGEKVLLGGKPFGLAVAPRTSGLALTGTFEKKVLLVKNGQIVQTKDVAYTPQGFAFSPDESEVAVGGDDKHIHVYKLNGTSLGAETVLEGHRDTPTEIDYSPDGRYIASGDKNRCVFVWENHQLKITDWVYHTAAIGSLKWSPNGRHVASVALDAKIIVWNVEDPKNRVTVDAAHHGGINDVDWIDESTLVTVGQDATTRVWNITFN